MGVLPDLSNGPGVDVSQMHVWEVLVFQIRPGHEDNFSEAAKLYKTTLGQAKIEAPWATYGVMAGMPGPTYLVFIPHRTLAEIDPATGTGAAIEKAFNEEAGKKLSSLAEGYLQQRRRYPRKPGVDREELEPLSDRPSRVVLPSPVS